jgi:hypothetical protein
MKASRAVLLALALMAGAAHAGFVEDSGPGAGDEAFRTKLRRLFGALERSGDPLLQRLRTEVLAAPARIRVRPMTADPKTWSAQGSRTEAHTVPDDGQPKNLGRTRPTGATVFIPPDTLDPQSSRWKSGVLPHELTHALDLANGRYSPDAAIRERRATFMQNAWCEHLGSPPRASYHGRFDTLDWQEAKQRHATEQYASYIFTRADFPPAPKSKGPPARDKDD